jgi:hypothetical protein
MCCFSGLRLNGARRGGPRMTNLERWKEMEMVLDRGRQEEVESARRQREVAVQLDSQQRRGTERKRWLQEAAQAQIQLELQLAANGAFATGGGGGEEEGEEGGGGGGGGERKNKVDLRDETQDQGGQGRGQQARGAQGGRVLRAEETEKTQVCQ